MITLFIPLTKVTKITYSHNNTTKTTPIIIVLLLFFLLLPKTMSPTSTLTPSSPRSFPSSPLPVSATPSTVVMSPCAACKILRRRCADKCVLAPYFPPTDPLKFTIAHKVFGASNIIKLLQDLPESQRADSVSSMVYEANARLRDPIYGCAGAICQLQKQVNELQAELAKSRAEIVNVQCQQTNLLALIYMQDHHRHVPVTPVSPQNHDPFETNTSVLNFYDDNYIWEPLYLDLNEEFY